MCKEGLTFRRGTVLITSCQKKYNAGNTLSGEVHCWQQPVRRSTVLVTSYQKNYNAGNTLSGRSIVLATTCQEKYSAGNILSGEVHYWQQPVRRGEVLVTTFQERYSTGNRLSEEEKSTCVSDRVVSQCSYTNNSNEFIYS
jgi:hypothetical protein